MQINYMAVRVAAAAFGAWFWALHMFLIDDMRLIGNERWVLSFLAAVFFVSMNAVVQKKPETLL